MKQIKKTTVFVTMVIVFLSSYIGTVKSKEFYYFESLPGLVDNPSESFPFCQADDCVFQSSEFDVDITILNPVVSVGLGQNVTNTISLSGADKDDAQLLFTSSDELLVKNDDLANLQEGDVTIYSSNIIDEGAVRILVKAVIDGGVIDQDYFEIEVSDNSCNTTTPLSNMVKDAGDNYLIGRKSDGSDNALLSKKQLLCLSNNQTGEVLSAKYKLKTNVEFFSNEKNEDWNNDGSSDGASLGDEEVLVGGWVPLGNNTTKFSGTFDGANKTISNLYINRVASYQGLFGYISGATISNVELDDLYIKASSHSAAIVGRTTSTASNLDNLSSSGEIYGAGSNIGGLVGWLVSSSISNSSSSANVTANGEHSYSGGIAGRADSFTMTRCDASGDIYGAGYFTGGLIGGTWGSNNRVYDSSATGNVSAGLNTTGGLIGLINDTAKVTGSFATGNVSAGAFVGGLIGHIGFSNVTTLSGSILEDCYATGDVIGRSSSVGGLVGRLYNSKTIENSYATGAVTNSSSSVGGLVGYSSGSINNSYATGNVTGKYSSVGGLAGSLRSTIGINSSYATGNVESLSSSSVGGLIGSSNANIINTSYATGNVKTTSSRSGGLIGYSNGSTINSSYANWNASPKGYEYVGGLIGYDYNATSITNNANGVCEDSGLVGVSSIGTYVCSTQDILDVQNGEVNPSLNISWDQSDWSSPIGAVVNPQLSWDVNTWDYSNPDGDGNPTLIWQHIE